MFMPAYDEPLYNCPYDTCHFVRDCRILIHLTKCRKAYVKKSMERGTMIDFRTCKYNDLHVVPSVELDYHEEFCPDGINTILEKPDIQEPEEPDPDEIQIPVPAEGEELTTEQLTNFRKNVESANIEIETNWEADVVLNPCHNFEYDHDLIPKTYKYAAQKAAKDQDNAIQTSPPADIPLLRTDSDYIFEKQKEHYPGPDSDSSDSDSDSDSGEEDGPYSYTGEPQKMIMTQPEPEPKEKILEDYTGAEEKEIDDDDCSFCSMISTTTEEEDDSESDYCFDSTTDEEDN